ncbi:unnamed protein product [Sympodiomycopsis kandeliae]
MMMMMVPSTFTILLLSLFVCSISDVDATTPPSRVVLARQVGVGGGGDVDPDALASARSALSIYNGVGTTAFTLPTGTTCPVGYQSYTNAAGLQRCCAGSIVNNRCFQDDGTLVYTADPEAVIDGETTPPGAVATTAAPVDGDGGLTTPGVVTNTRLSSTRSSTGPFVLSSSYRPTATGGTLRGDIEPTSSRSTLQQSLVPTGGSGDSADSNNKGITGGATSSVKINGQALLAVSLVSTGAVLLASMVLC